MAANKAQANILFLLPIFVILVAGVFLVRVGWRNIAGHHHRWTCFDLENDGILLELYYMRHGKYPISKKPVDFSQIVATVDSDRDLYTILDRWGTPLLYFSYDGAEYNLVSGGSDGSVNARIDCPLPRYGFPATDIKSDIVMSSGSMYQYGDGMISGMEPIDFDESGLKDQLAFMRRDKVLNITHVHHSLISILFGH